MNNCAILLFSYAKWHLMVWDRRSFALELLEILESIINYQKYYQKLLELLEIIRNYWKYLKLLKLLELLEITRNSWKLMETNGKSVEINGN